MSVNTITKEDILLIFKTPQLYNQLTNNELLKLININPKPFLSFFINPDLKRKYLEVIETPDFSQILSDNPFLERVNTFGVKNKSAYILYLQAKYNKIIAEIILNDGDFRKILLKNDEYLSKIILTDDIRLKKIIIIANELDEKISNKTIDEIKYSILSRIVGALLGGLVGMLTHPFISSGKLISDCDLCFIPIAFIFSIPYGLVRGVHRGALGGILEAIKIPYIFWNEEGHNTEIISSYYFLDGIFPPYSYWTPVPKFIVKDSQTITDQSTEVITSSETEPLLSAKLEIKNPQKPLFWKKVRAELTRADLDYLNNDEKILSPAVLGS